MLYAYPSVMSNAQPADEMPFIATPAPSTSDRLTEVRAKRAALKAQLAEIAAASADVALLAAEELAYADDQAVAAAITKLGPVGVKCATVSTRLGVIIVRRPAESAFKEFQELEPSKLGFDAYYAYARKCIEYPTVAAFDAIMRELPGVAPDLVLALNKLMGVSYDERGKK